MRSRPRALTSAGAVRGVAMALMALWLLDSGTTRAQEIATLRVSLEDAQERAVAASHRLAEMRARAAANEGAVTVRETADRPVVAVVGGYTRTNHVTEFVIPGATGVSRVLYPDAPDNYRARLDAQWPIYDGGRNDALERAARAEASAASADVASAQADLRLDVASVYWALVTAGASVAVLEESVARAEAHVRDARQRLNVGLVSPSDVAMADAQRSRQQMLLIEARNQRALLSAELARLIGVDLSQPIEAAAELDLAPPASSEGPDLVAEARTSRTERRALQQRIEAADFVRQSTLATKRPVIALGGGFDLARPNPKIFPRVEQWNDSWDAGITASWSLWDGGRARAAAAQAASSTVAARERLAEFDSVLALEIRQRQLEITSGRAAVAASEDAVLAAAEARRVVEERYQAGVVAQTEVLDAEVELLQTQLERTRAMANVRLAEARLTRALGR